MKRHLIATVAVLVVLVVVIAAVGQQEGTRQGRSGRGGGAFMTREARLEAIKTIEAELAKLKAEPDVQRPEGGFQNLPEEERTKFFEQMTKVRQERQKVLDAIIAQVATLQGSRAPEAAEGAKFVIVNTADLKPIQEAAVKEKATETSQLLERLMARASGQRGFGAGQRGEGGERPQRQRQQQ